MLAAARRGKACTPCARAATRRGAQPSPAAGSDPVSERASARSVPVRW